MKIGIGVTSYESLILVTSKFDIYQGMEEAIECYIESIGQN